MKRDSVGLYPRERDLGGIWDFDAQNADELRDRFPQGKPCAMEKPSRSVLVSAAARAPERSSRTRKGAACHCGLYEEHVSACDMAQNPVGQLAVVRGCVHAESSEEVGDSGQIVEVNGSRDECVYPAADEQYRYQKEGVGRVGEILSTMVLFCVPFVAAAAPFAVAA